MNQNKLSAQYIGTIEAGPELDRLVAEKVMGWTYAGPFMRLGKSVDSWREPTGGHRLYFQPSSPSGIAQAWLVVKHLTEAKRDWQFRHTCYASEALVTGLSEWVQAPTMELAICRAALAAVGVDPQ